MAITSPPDSAADAASTATPRRHSRRSAAVRLVAGTLVVYLAAAYLILPAGWKRYVHHHPALADVPGITHTSSGIPGDPINVSLIGTKAQVIRVMHAAGWDPADPLTLKSSLEIIEATVLRRRYVSAPVSNLYLWGRKEDLAFEKPIGKDPSKRHHVRFWRAEKDDPAGRPVWVGSDILDAHVGFSRTTGQITHVTGPDIDAERDLLFRDLERTGDLSEMYVVNGFHRIRHGRNGGGDPWHTDGDLYVGVIEPGVP